MENHGSDGDDELEELGDGGPGGANEDPPSDENIEEEHFDITLAATHSYMGPGLVEVGGRSVREAGWAGRVPCAAHRGCVFPGETVPMLLPDPHDAAILTDAIKHDKLFGLLFPDEDGNVSGYGVLCEVFEASLPERGAAPAPALSFKARANHRFRFKKMPRKSISINAFDRVVLLWVVVLEEAGAREPLRRARLASLDPLRRGRGPGPGPARTPLERRLRALDAAATPWPRFLYDMFDFRRMRQLLQDYFRTISLDKLPEEPVSLSFWVASNLELSARDRLALFAADDALLRLHMETTVIARKSVLCCAACGAAVARRDHVLAMSSDGVHSNYTNLGGYMHDIVTVSSASNVELTGAASAEFSWFPGYAWTIALCAACASHVGWRFDALKRSLRPQQFFGLSRSSVQPREERPGAEPELPLVHTRPHW